MRRSAKVGKRVLAWVLTGGALLTGALLGSSLGFPESGRAFGPTTSHLFAAATRIVLVTIDGVRREELSGDLDLSLDPRVSHEEMPAPFFWSTLVPRGRLLGMPGVRPAVTVANSEVISLPAYQSMMAGRPQPCFSNGCGRLYMDHTLPERLVKDLGWPRAKVATFASWERIADAVEATPGTTFVNAGQKAWDIDDPEIRGINETQSSDSPPWQHARWDRYTTAMALQYLQRERPKFLYVSLNDTDEWGHKGAYREHINALHAADDFLRDLTGALAATEATGDEPGERTCLLITTDHGRGRGDKWTAHSNGTPTAAFVWAYASCDPLGVRPLSVERTDEAGTTGSDRRFYTHLDMRPTLERWLGLAPHDCVLCGEPIEEFLE